MFIGLGMPITGPGGAAGESLGPELVTNGDMDGDTGWTFTVLDGSEPTMAGAMVFDGLSDVMVEQTAADTVVEGNYRATWTEGSLGAQISGINVGGGDGTFTPAAGAGSQDFAITVVADQKIFFRSEYATGTLDGLSIKQIL